MSTLENKEAYCVFKFVFKAVQSINMSHDAANSQMDIKVNSSLMRNVRKRNKISNTASINVHSQLFDLYCFVFFSFAPLYATASSKSTIMYFFSRRLHSLPSIR